MLVDESMTGSTDPVGICSLPALMIEDRVKSQVEARENIHATFLPPKFTDLLEGGSVNH